MFPKHAIPSPHVEPTPAQQDEATFHAVKGAIEDAVYAFRPSTSSSSYGVEASLAAIMDQLQHMHANFGCHIDHISDGMCQMNTRIGRIARRQSNLGGFAPSPSLEPAEDYSDGGDNGDDASGSSSDNEMIASY